MKFFILLLFLINTAYGESFSFEKDMQEWGSWGEGVGGHDLTQGKDHKGSLRLACDWGEVQTLHYRWSNLKPGTYHIRFYIRAENVQAHPDKVSFWNFVDTGEGTQDIFTDLQGNYEWRKVEYTVDVKKGLSFWLRLKSPGVIWMDDFSLTPASAKVTLQIEPPKEFTSSVTKDKRERTQKTLTLLDFDKISPHHPFVIAKDKTQRKVGSFKIQQYYNFDPQKFLQADWSDYDRIGLDIYNPTHQFVEFFLTLGDSSSQNYWGQLNHKTHLAPGWNKLSFDLKQFLGERGSHRFHRSLDLKKIQKWFIVADPNNKLKNAPSFFVDNIKLTRNPPPYPENGVYAFDFTSHKDQSHSGFTPVTSRDYYQEQKGFGFVAPEFWRVEDSAWVGSPLRYSIGLTKGQFRVKVPNGKYKVNLQIERLGYWDVSFWKDRSLSINGKMVFKETRDYAADYLKDLLQFEAITPSPDDHPYDLYLKRIFRPLKFSADVTNGVLDFSFEGDPTGISLNSLVLAKVSDSHKMDKFLEKVDQRLKDEFDWMTREIKPTLASNKTNSQIGVIKPSLELSPHKTYPASEQLIFKTHRGEKRSQLVQVRHHSALKWSLGDFVSSSGAKIPATQIKVYEIIPQFVSPDLNHETYFVAGKFLKSASSELQLSPEVTKYLWLEYTGDQQTDSGLYKGQMNFTGKGFTKTLPMEISLSTMALPKIDFPVGFFGPDPIPHSYFQGDISKSRENFRLKAIARLGQDGFTTIAGLPDESESFFQTIKVANDSGMSGVYFSYGGQFPQKYLEDPEKKEELQKIYTGLNTKIVHTFSDEAGGYSNKIEEDLSLGQKLKQEFPFIPLGGFSSLNDSRVEELNTYFQFPFFSNVSKSKARRISSHWGSYNASPGNLDDPRFSFGPGLYFARKMGLGHYLEWHASAVNNYPYYDFDGRESDVVMFMPSFNGDLYSTLRYELAVQGLQSFRKLTLLEKNLKTHSHPEAKKWLRNIEEGSLSSLDNVLKSVDHFRFEDFESKLDQFLNATSDLSQKNTAQLIKDEINGL